MNKFFQTTTKVILLVSSAGLMMGNKSCKKDAPVEKPRALKKIIEMAPVQAPSVTTPGGSFDFQFVANNQLLGVVFEQGDFALHSQPPVSVNQVDGQTTLNLSQGDKNLLNTAAGNNYYSLEYSEDAWCFVNLPMARVSTAIQSFEMLGEKGLAVGYTPNGSYGLTGVGVNFKIKQSQLSMGMAAYRPINSEAMAAVNVSSKQTRKDVNFTINFGLLSLNPSYFNETPLSEVTKNALSKAVNGLSVGLKNEEWYTRVMANHDTELTIIGGRDINLKEGDELLVYNERYYWDGKPCASKYLGGGAAANSAVAKIKISWVGDVISGGTIIEQTENNPVVGAKVKLFKLVDATAAQPAPGVKP